MIQRPVKQLATGICGLDQILNGGLTPNRVYLIDGTPGCGKTTLGLQFLLEGVRQGEKVLYVSLAESREELHEVAHSHGWDLSLLDIVESAAGEENLRPEHQATMFHDSEIELNETMERILERVEKIRPARVVFDSLAELRLLAQNPLRHRRQIVALKRYFARWGCTVLMLDDSKLGDLDLHLQTAAHGVIQLEQMPPEYGAERRRLRVVKMRGNDFTLGWHDFVIRAGGLDVFPRLVAAEHWAKGPHRGFLSSGVKELDTLTGGGLSLGTNTLIIGPAGVGKTTLAYQWAIAAGKRGQQVTIFSFDEGLHTTFRRAALLGMPLEELMGSGRIQIETVDPGQISPGEFANRIVQAAEPIEGHQGASLIVVDSLNGYLNATPEEKYLLIQLHELLTYLGQHGVTTLIVMPQHGILGSDTHTPIDVTYLSDNLILLRFFEAGGEMKRAISVVKMRSGWHENTIREFQIGKGGVFVGEPLREFQGILTGEPVFTGGLEPLMSARR